MLRAAERRASPGVGSSELVRSPAILFHFKETNPERQFPLSGFELLPVINGGGKDAFHSVPLSKPGQGEIRDAVESVLTGTLGALAEAFLATEF